MKKKRFIIFTKEEIHKLPPVMTIAYSAKDLGYEVQIVTQNVIDDVKYLLEKDLISILSIENKRGKNPLEKLRHWYRFSKFAGQIYKKLNEDDVIWVTGVDTAIAMRLSVLKQKKFYFQINELYDQFPYYLKKIKQITSLSEKNIVPEINRASILQVWSDLKQRPEVLPNKPFFNDKLINEGEARYKEHIDYIESEKKKGKLICLYQGHISRYNRDISPLLEAIEKKGNISVVLMGPDHYSTVDYYKEKCSSIYYIPSIPAPFHLTITKYADFGVLMYAPSSLNNIYCAPNKIWEYTKYGVVPIGNDIIGLHFLTSERLGVQCDFQSISDISAKLDNLSANIDEFKKNSLSFYENLDIKEELKHILAKN